VGNKTSHYEAFFVPDNQKIQKNVGFPRMRKHLLFYKSRNKEDCMKKTIKVLGLIALVAVIGFSFAACGGDDGGGGGSGSGGTFTLTDIPSQYDGKYIYFDSADRSYPVFGFQSCETGGEILTVTGCKISNGKASIPTWSDWYDSPDGKFIRFTKSITLDSSYSYLRFFIMDTQKYTIRDANNLGIKFHMGNVKFTDGSATKSWNDGALQ
jgi:hypothetical protein